MACTRLRRTQLVHEDTRLTQFAYKLQNRVTAAICANAGGGGGEVNWSNFLFVDQEDPSITPERGSLTNKYETIQDAVDAALEGDVILVNPGEYNDPVTLDLTNIKDNVTIQGSGSSETKVINISFLKEENDEAIQNLTIKNLSVTGSVNVDVENALFCFLTGKLTLQDMEIGTTSGADSNFSRINNLKIDSVAFNAESAFNNCGILDTDNVDFNQKVYLKYDFTETAPIVGRNEYRFSACKFLLIEPRNQVVVYFDSECVASSISASDLSYNLQGNPLITFAGKITDVDVVYDIDIEGAPALIGNFDHSEVTGRFIWKGIEENDGDFGVTAKNAVLSTTTPNNISADGDINGTGESHCCMDLSNSTFNQVAIDIMTGGGAGGIDRTLWSLDSMEIPTDVADVVTGFPRYVNPTYTVHFELDGDALSDFGVIEVKSKTVSQYQVLGALVGAPLSGIHTRTKLIQNA